MNIMRESYAAGEFIFLERDQDSHFYIIEEGSVEICTSQDGNYIRIAEFGPGESFGEFAMLTREARSASARAMTNVELVKVTEEGFQELLAQLPDWASSMLKSFAARLRTMTARLKEYPDKD